MFYLPEVDYRVQDVRFPVWGFKLGGEFRQPMHKHTSGLSVCGILHIHSYGRVVSGPMLLKASTGRHGRF